MRIPYRAYEAESAEAIKGAIADIGKLEQTPLVYTERIPQYDLSRWAYVLAALALGLLLAAKLCERTIKRPGVTPMQPSSIRTILVSRRGPALWILAAASVLCFGYAANDLISARAQTDNIRQLVDRRDVPIDVKRAHPQEILARISKSVRRDHIDDAQSILSIAGATLPPSVRASALYNIANARTRMAAEAVRKGQIDSAAALINLAKSEYRLALKLDPQSWDARLQSRCRDARRSRSSASGQ